MQAHEFEQNPAFDEEQDQQQQRDHAFDDEHDQQHRFEHKHHQQPEEPIFPRGPYDLSVLKEYEHHIAINVWNGQDRRALNIVSNGKKEDKFIDIRYVLPAQTDNWIIISELRHLQRCSLHMIDGNLISAFAERWHTETSSFHLPFGEMTITLDNVMSILSIPCYGEFFTPPANVNEDLAIVAAVELLGVDYDKAVIETRTNRGASYSFEWLKAVFFKQLHEGRYDCASRVYLLHLAGCTILADKSFTLVFAKYLFLFQDLDTCGKWAWGPAALVVLYDYLSYKAYNEADWRIFVSISEQTSRNIAYYRAKLDALRDTNIIWTPNYDANSMTRFSSVSLFTGYILWCSTMVSYFPERCTRQFGYTQHIPPTPPMLVVRDVDVEWSMYRNSWYYKISHPRMIHYIAVDDGVGPSYDADVGRSPSHDVGSDNRCTRCHEMGGLIQQSLDLYMGDPKDEMCVLLERALHIFRGGDY
uniref:Protein MAIN-LIKE 1-like n=1 Tax=Cicer arietinum TaxID=3827 RepID=A0A1S2YLB7_CICAR|nr:protein MAIN-LIKE 1-like [Cicer arietinum]